ncbi:hypothetical protein [Ureibacillus acetophenoni]
MIERLLSIFGTEMNILHTVTREELEQYLPQKIAKLIDQARKGELTIDVGGAGKYGKVH